MRDFYQKYKKSEKLTTLSSEISRSHNVAILSKCKDSLESEFYMKMAKRNGWSYRVLIHQIEVGALDFLSLANKHSEQELEKAILKFER